MLRRIILLSLALAALAIPDMEALCAQNEVAFRPVLFAGLLKAFGHLGPAEIPAKRMQTYRIVQWIADERGLPFRAPPAHPFNPLALLRLLCARELSVADAAAAFRLVWGEGHDPQNPETAAALAEALGRCGEGLPLAVAVALTLGEGEAATEREALGEGVALCEWLGEREAGLGDCEPAEGEGVGAGESEALELAQALTECEGVCEAVA
jgi:2-hydroxychromene-2-carboxylate isomerase